MLQQLLGQPCSPSASLGAISFLESHMLNYDPLLTSHIHRVFPAASCKSSMQPCLASLACLYMPSAAHRKCTPITITPKTSSTY